MARGGKRQGAGRKKGVRGPKTKARLAVTEEVLAAGVQPLQVMLEAMRRHYDAKDLDRAAELAKDAAPYCHPRLATVEVGGKEGSPPIPITFIEVAASDAPAAG